jgi:S-adenosylmethionine-diacylgycerolhomoserine-N-methlytransferase
MTVARDRQTEMPASVAMDRMYRWQHSFYDLTRKPYLLGRDRLIETIRPPAGAAVLEIGCGTGRNLIAAARKWPHAHFFGYDVSSVMLDHAQRAVQRAGLDGRISLAQGDACSFDPREAFGAPRFDRLYFSYVLSMIPPWREALGAAASLLEPGGSLHIADFGDQQKLGAMFRAPLNLWLSAFNVQPRLELASEIAGIARSRHLRFEIDQIYRGYAVVAALHRPAVPTF